MKVTGSIRVNTYEIVARAVEVGVACGYHRAHKYTEKPTESDITTSIETEVMNALTDVLVFEPCEI
jgi:hypothetical protein